MMKLTRFLVVLGFLLSLLIASSSFATTVPISLVDFYSEGATQFSADGLTAMMNGGYAYLANDPFLGDPGIIVPEAVQFLKFNLIFEATDPDDELEITLFDGESGDFIETLDLYESWDRLVYFDLTNLAPTTTLLGLDFYLESWITSTNATISNLHFTTAPVPEPSTLLLLGAGLTGLLVIRRRKG